jgi:hypothetical protein
MSAVGELEGVPVDRPYAQPVRALLPGELASYKDTSLLNQNGRSTVLTAFLRLIDARLFPLSDFAIDCYGEDEHLSMLIPTGHP